MGYDHWKTTNPQDEFLGSVLEDEEPPLFCYSCGDEVSAPDTLCRTCDRERFEEERAIFSRWED